jgi:hypothetical protein
MECGEINCVAFTGLQFAALLSLRFRVLPGMPPRSKRSPASQPLAPRSLQELAKESQKCRNCDLWRNATQTVFGQGSSGAPIMLIGEAPGDQEDRQGKPFVGPAGTLLRMLLNEAGIDLKQVYLTNVVKHFKVGAARKTSHPQNTQQQRDKSLPVLARRGNRSAKSESDRLPWCHGSSSAARTRVPGNPAPRGIDRFRSSAVPNGDRSPLRDSSRS